MQKNREKKTAAWTQGALSIRPNIPVWNSGYSMWRMAGLTRPRSPRPISQTKRKQTAESLWAFLLALDLLDDLEVETNDITFKSSPRLLWGYDNFPDEFKSHFRMTKQAVHALDNRSFSHYLQKLVVTYPLQ